MVHDPALGLDPSGGNEMRELAAEVDPLDVHGDYGLRGFVGRGGRGHDGGGPRLDGVTDGPLPWWLTGPRRSSAGSPAAWRTKARGRVGHLPEMVERRVGMPPLCAATFCGLGRQTILSRICWCPTRGAAQMTSGPDSASIVKCR